MNMGQNLNLKKYAKRCLVSHCKDLETITTAEVLSDLNGMELAY